MIKKTVYFFDRLEDRVRSRLSRSPILYAFLGGVGVVLFWRGIWHLADNVNMGAIVSVILGSIILLITGIFVSAFVGNRLIISGLSGDKKLAEKTVGEIETEEDQLQRMQKTLNRVENKIDEIENELDKK
ncbi:MAG: hypothetical protein ABL899_00075 [Nitrospira sp.]